VPPWTLAPPSSVPPAPPPFRPTPYRREPSLVVVRPWWGRTSVWIAVGAVVAATAIGAYVFTRDNDICGGCPRVDLR
jgi:hypothetical protein